MVEFIHKYDIYQAKKRAQALKAVKSDLTKKFIRVYRGFRHRKYGEPYPEHELKAKQPTQDNFSDISAEQEVDYPDEIKLTAHQLQNQLQALETYVGKKTEEPKPELEAVSEEGIEDEMIETKKDYANHVQLVIEECAMIKEIVVEYKKIMKVKWFLKMVICRYRYLKKKKGAQMVQRYVKSFVARRPILKQLTEAREQKQVAGVKLQIKSASKEQLVAMHKASDVIS